MSKKLHIQVAKINHTGHRARMRTRFTDSSLVFDDHAALELLLNGYYTRCDTNYFSRLLLQNKNISELIREYEQQNLNTAGNLEHYLGICSEIIVRASGNKTPHPVLLQNALADLPMLYRFLSAYFFTPDTRIAYLCLDRNLSLTKILFSRFGEAELPIALEHCHLLQTDYVVPVFCLDRVSSADAADAIRYYLDKMEKCPRNWCLYGVLLLYRGHCRLIRLEKQLPLTNGGDTV